VKAYKCYNAFAFKLSIFDYSMSGTMSGVILNDMSNSPIKELREFIESARRLLATGQDCAKSTEKSRLELHKKTSAAKTEMQAFISTIQAQLTRFAVEFEENIDEYLKREDAIMFRRLNDVTMLIAAAKNKRLEIQSVLNNAGKCQTYGAALISSCEAFFEKSFKSMDKISGASEEYNDISFVPRIQITVNQDDIGYIKYCELDPTCTDVIVNLDENNQVPV